MDNMRNNIFFILSNIKYSFYIKQEFISIKLLMKFQTLTKIALL